MVKPKEASDSDDTDRPDPPEPDFDFAAARTNPKPTNVIESIGHYVKGCLGGGILGIPEAYMRNGLYSSVVFTIAFGLYVTYCIYILVKSAQVLYVRHEIAKMSYPDLAQMSVERGPFPKWRNWGKKFRYAVDFVICVDLFGSCCVYLIIMAKTVQQLIDENDVDVNRIRMYIIMIYPAVILLSMIRSLKYLAPFTLVADFFIVLCVIATVHYGLEKAPPINEVPVFKTLVGFVRFCGVVVYSMEGVGVVLPIENNMKEPKKFCLVLSGGMTIVVSFVLTTGFFGYWGFGDNVLSPVTLNFPHTLCPYILKALIGIMVYITFALNFWAPFNLVWHYVQKKYPVEKHYIWERVYRALFVTGITINAIIFPKIGSLMGLIGSFCLSNMGFIFPAIIETLVMYEYPGLGYMKWRLWKNILIIVLGFYLFSSGTYFNAKSLFDL